MIPYLPAVSTVVLVEGVSDQRAVQALARRRGRDLEDEGVAVVPMGGAQAIAGFVERYGPRGRAASVAAWSARSVAGETQAPSGSSGSVR